MCFLTNLRLYFLNNQQVSLDKKYMQDLIEYSPLTVDELDDAAFLSWQDLKTPRYHDAIEKYMIEAMEEDEGSQALPVQEVPQAYSSLQSGMRYGQPGQMDRYGYSTLPHETGNSRASNGYIRNTMDLQHNISANRESIGDPFAQGYSSQRATNYPVQADEYNDSLPPDLGGSYMTSGYSGRMTKGNASSKLEELNQSYQKYINYLQYQTMMKNYYTSNDQQQNLYMQNQTFQDDGEGSEEADELETDQDTIMTVTPADFYDSLLGLELSSVAYQGKPDYLISKIVTIQSFYRGWITRKRLLLKSIFDRASILIQACYRGHRVRRRIQPALRQLHRTIKEEQKKIDIEATIKIQESSTGTDKADKKLDSDHSTLAPLQQKLLELEEDNKKMRDKLDQQSELMLNLLASQNMGQLNTSNRLLSELKDEINVLKDKSKTDMAHKSEKQKHKKVKLSAIDPTSPNKSKRIEGIEAGEVLVQSLRHASDLPKDHLSEARDLQKNQGETLPAKQGSDQGKQEEDKDSQKQASNLEKITKLVSYQEESPNDPIGSKEELVKVIQKIDVNDAESQEGKKIQVQEEIDEPNLRQMEDAKITMVPISKADQDRPSTVKIQTSNQDYNNTSEEGEVISEDEENQFDPRSQPYKHQPTFQPPERHLSSRRTASDLDKHESPVLEYPQSPSLVATAYPQSESFHFELPFDLDQQVPQDEYEPPEDEFIAHLMDELNLADQNLAENELSHLREDLPVVLEESPKRGAIKKTTVNKTGYGYGGKSTTSRGSSSNRAYGYGTSQAGNLGALNKSSTSSRPGTATKGKTPTAPSRERGSGVGGVFGQSPKNKTTTASKLASPSLGVNSLKKNSMSLLTRPGSSGMSSNKPLGGGNLTSTIKPQAVSTTDGTATSKKPVAAPKKTPLASSGGQSIRSMMSSMGKGTSTSLYGRR